MDVSQELVERCVALVRVLADVPTDSVLGQSGYASEARAIVALLPKPVDPDLIEAREFYIQACGGVDCDADVVQRVRRGERDHTDYMQAFLAAIKRARALSASSGETRG